MSLGVLAMYDKMTDKCRDAFRVAHSIAKTMNLDVLNTDSLLLAIVRSDGNGVVSCVLKNVNVLDDLRAHLKKLGNLSAEFSLPLLQSEDARQSLESAKSIAAQFDHHYIGIEHIFLGLLGRCPLLEKVSREADVSLDRFRRDVYTILGIDQNTDEDYDGHLLKVKDTLAQGGDSRTIVKEIYDYLKAQLP